MLLPPLEFFVDRNLGRSTPARLREQGWTLHLIAEEFPDDAQDISDEVWLDHGLARGWVPLCKDGRIRGRDHERAPIERHGGVLFYLDNQQLKIDEMVRRILGAEADIIAAVTRGGPALYAIGTDSIRRTWP